jgi:hypothetical protein
VTKLRELEEAVGSTADRWHGRCYEIACVAAKLYGGRPIYGHWLGGVKNGGHWAERAGHPFIAHGWLLLADGKVLDPTRWSFENVEPYVFVGESEGEYDEGGNRLREKLLKPCPAYAPDGGGTRLPRMNRRVELELDPHVWAFLMGLSDGEIAYRDGEPWMTLAHAFWVANLPLSMFTDKEAKAVFGALRKAKLGALVPADNMAAVDALG